MQPLRNPTPSDAIVEALVALLVPRIAAELAKRTDSAATFTSTELPPRVTRRAFREACKAGRVEAWREGRGWACTREAWFAARRSTPAPALRLAAPLPPSSEAEAAARDLEAAGLRATRRAG
jgi:hypothetical protein